ncbi:NAD-dependent epimerase/dehydratase family protein [Halobacteriaceae archaeon GCM10025711]
MPRDRSPGHDVTDETVLVTGGAGFIGSHVADALVEDNDVRVLDDLSSGRRENVPSGAELIRGDVRDPDLVADAMAGVDLVFHEAAMVSVPESVENPLGCHETNATATVRLLEAARAEDARVVYASSAAVYGRPESVPLAEGAPKRPTSPYGIEKLATDHYVRAYADLYDLETVALRYFNVYGPRQAASDYSAVIDAFVEQALAGGPITVEGDGTQTRDFVHVSDVVQANLLAATTPHVGEAFNVGTGTSVSVLELARKIREATGVDADVVHTDPRPGDIDQSCPDIEKARSLLGYEPTVTLDDGLGSVVEER